jgi:hypothetical protein
VGLVVLEVSLLVQVLLAKQLILSKLAQAVQVQILTHKEKTGLQVVL